MTMRTGRVRAWLLVKATDPEAAQRGIAPLMVRNKMLPDDDVVIRADTIVDCEFNLVVPVDVTGEPALKRVVCLVFGVDGVKSVTIAQVKEYCPAPAVEAHCYITEGETGGAYPESGRYPRSPGANPWG
jgi:hypothetical protein